MAKLRWVFLVSFVLSLSPFALAQDPSIQASQDAAMQASQMATQAAQQANDDAMRAAQTASENAANASQATMNIPAIAWTAAPTFSIAAGTVNAGTTVRLKSRTHYAEIYYTTNGWTPTTSSKRYTGPIEITRSMQVQAIAVAPGAQRSVVASAKYAVRGAVATFPPTSVDTDGVLKAGTRLHLVTDASLNSKTAQVGDTLKLVLAEDVKVGDTVVVPKGTPVEAKVTIADRAGHAGTPGDVAFEVQGLKLDGRSIPLKGGETLEGANHYTRAKGLVIIPVVGLGALALHGDEAEIKPGMTLSASVAADTPLQP